MTTTEERQRLLQEVRAAVQAQDLPRATALARDALGRGVEDAFLLNLRAFWHEQEGRGTDALTDLIQAQRLAPNDTTVLNALGLAYARQGRMREAAQAFDRALGQDPDFAPAHFNKGWTSEDLGELKTARQSYAQAVRLMPGAADPLAHLAALAARQGDWMAAREHATGALAIQPRHPLAILALAGAESAARDHASAEKRLIELLAGSALSPADRARAEGALADILDAQGRFAEAFAAYARRNRILGDIHRPRYAGAGVETMPTYLRWLTDAFAQSPAELWAGATPAATTNGPRGHVFVLGFARSGTTLIEEILAGDPDVVTTQERDALVDSVREFLVTPAGLARLAEIGRGALRNARTQYWRRIEEFGLAAAGKVLIDKQPFNTYKLPLIAKLFPEARILFSLRDPRDVVLSCYRRQFRMNASTFEFLTLEGTARLYAATMQAAELFRARLPLAVHELRNEDLVADFDAQMAAVCGFVGLEQRGALRDFAERGERRAVATPSSAQIKRGLNSAGIAHWRNYRDQLAPVFPLLAPWIARFGYPPD